ncbi:GNAT family N-acetyltransferase [Halorarum halobium]|uniref:GNAT family N-acetyltransferase n=1 Tax=Halorarum halobium TaxID=3075121 RepID=UPI0028A84214|nr:GNAT family N-acetyltransferase [Halobaculum sp. XH14]
MSVEVRPARRDDVDGLCRVAERAWHVAHAPIIGGDAVESFLNEHYDAESFRALVAADAVVLRAALGSDGVVGFVSARPREGGATFDLGRIYVHPDRWGEGIGGRLLDRAETAVRERGGDRIELGVMAENDRAVAFYESAGYDRVGEFYDDRIDADGYTYANEL